MRHRHALAAGLAGALLLSPGLGIQRARAVERAAQPSVKTIITGIDGTIVATSARAHRALVVGRDERVRVNAPTVYGLVDTQSGRMVARGPADNFDAATVDERRGRIYLIGESSTYSAATGTRTYALAVLTLDLRSGRVVARRSIVPGQTWYGADAAAVDPASGALVLGLYQRFYTTNASIAWIDPTTGLTAMRVLPGPASALSVDDGAHRIMAVSQIGPYPTTTTVTAWGTRSLRPAWSHAYGYALAGTIGDARAHRLWTVAPGGLVSTLDAATGRVAAAMHLAYTRPGDWTQGAVVLDQGQGVAYGVWQEGVSGPCHIDRADPRTGTRRTVATYDCATAGTTLIGYDPAHRALVTAGGTTVARVNSATGVAGPLVTNLPALSYPHSWTQAVVLVDGKRAMVAVPDVVPHQDDETGATTASAILVIPVAS